MTANATELLERCDETVRAGQDALEWIRANESVVKHDFVQVDRSFRRHVMAARKMRAAVERPMCVGVFGASQAGKSYLISALARSGTGHLTTTLDGRRMDYLKEINPEGGKEATGLVTRFTVRDVPSLPGAPVNLRLLTETDLIKILGNSYLADVDHNTVEPPNGDVVAERLDKLRARAKPSPVDRLTEDDVFDLQDYFDRQFGGIERVKALRVTFWEAAAELAPRLDIAERAELFAILWDDLPAFTEVYVRLYGILAQLDFASHAYCGLEGLEPRHESIINVDTLMLLNAPEKASKVTLKSSTGRSSTVSRADAAALVAELTIKIDEKPWDFFDHTDLLDFPGARTREEIRNVHDYLSDGQHLHLFFRRGKVAYLYERYCDDQELTSMLLCVGPSNQEVVIIPAMIKRWIETTHGERPEDRAKQATALFLVLTKFDMEFASKRGSDEADLGTRWTTRLEASFLNFFGKQDQWPYQWDARDRPFTNIFWMRNPGVLDPALLDYDAAGSEVGVRDIAKARVDALRESYLGNETVQTYIAEPAVKWDAAMTLNDGGIGLLAERLRPVCRPELKLKQIEGRLAELRGRMIRRLKPYHVSSDREAERIKRRQELEEKVVPCLVDCMEATRFGVLQRSLMVTSREMERVFRQIRFRSSRPRTVAGSAADATIAPARSKPSGFAGMGLRDRVRPSTAAPANGAGTTAGATAGDTDPSPLFVDAVLQHWAGQMRGLAQDSQRCAFFQFDPLALDTLVNEVLMGAERFGIATEMAKSLHDWTRLSIDPYQAAPGAGVIAANMVNGYLRQLGFETRPSDKRPKVETEKGPRPIFMERADDGNLVLSEEPPAFDMLYCLDWIEAIRTTTEENASGGTDANTPENRRLSGILIALGEPGGTIGAPADG